MQRKPLPQLTLLIVSILTAGFLVPEPGDACDPRTGMPIDPSPRCVTRTMPNDWDPGGEFSHLTSLDASNFDSDCNIWLTPDELQLFFVRHAGVFGPADSLFDAIGGDWDIYYSEWDDVAGRWGPATNLGPNVNSSQGERRPSTSWDGDTLYFGSGASVYRSIRSSGEYGAREEIFFPAQHPMIGPNGNHMYYEWNDDIWIADFDRDTGEWTNLRELPGAVNTVDYLEKRPFVSWDDSLLFFSDFGGVRPNGYGGTDIWVSKRLPTGLWGPAESVPPPVNTDLPACTAYLSYDMQRLYVSSEAYEGARGTEDLWVSHLDSPVVPPVLTPPPGIWTKMGELAGAINVYDLAVAGDDTVYAATSPNGRVFRSVDGGQTWSGTAPIPGADICYSLLVSDTGLLFAGTYPEGDVWRSPNAGGSWLPCADLTGATSVRALLETTGGRILAGTAPNAEIFVSEDYGLSWTAVGTGTGQTVSGVLDLIEVPGTGTLLAGLWGSRVFRSVDDGDSWSMTFMEHYTNIGSSNTLLEIADGDTLYAAGWLHGEINGGLMWRSLNDGQDWWVVTDSIKVGPLKAIRIYDVEQLDTGRLICGFQPGPDSLVTTSSDGGSTWRAFGDLPGAREVLKLLPRPDGTVLAATAPFGDVYLGDLTLVSVPPPEDEAGPFGVAAMIGGFPNPFRRSTSLRYQLPRASTVELSVIDVRGRRVRTLSETAMPAGIHEIPWDGRDQAGRSVASGVYFVRLKAGSSITYQKVLLTR